MMETTLENIQTILQQEAKVEPCLSVCTTIRWIFKNGQTGNWYGLAICSNASGSDSSASAAIYDLSSIAKITFEAKSDTNNSVMNFSACTEDAVSYTLGTEYKTFTYDMTKATHAKNGKHYCMVSIVQNATTEPIVHYIKNIAFWDASGTEVVPEIVD